MELYIQWCLVAVDLVGYSIYEGVKIHIFLIRNFFEEPSNKVVKF